MKEVMGKARKTQPFLSCKIIVNNIEINEGKQITNEFNDFFIDIGPELGKAISSPGKSFESYVLKSNMPIPTGPVSVNELKKCLFLNK